jgi:integrase
MLHKHVLATFKGREVAALTTPELKKWRDGLLPAADADSDDEAMRRAKGTANKYQSYFWAALELAYETGHVATNDAWRRIKPFGNVDKPRDFYPSAAQVSTLLENCDESFRPLVRAGLLTGFRLQALSGAIVADFDAHDGTLNVRHDKGHERVAALSSAAVELFKQQAKDKLPNAYVFLRADGCAWGKSHQHRPFREACKKGKLPREFIFYSLRHYFISRALLAGVNVHALAKNVGTSPAMITKHYGKFIRTDYRDMLDRVEVAA